MRALTRKQAEQAWRLERDKGYSRVKVAQMYYVDTSTITRAYQAYGLQPPKHGRHKRKS